MEIPENVINEMLSKLHEVVDISESNADYDMSYTVLDVIDKLGKYSIRQQKLENDLNKLISQFSDVFKTQVEIENDKFIEILNKKIPS
jgi:hypothetical protein